MKFPAQIQNGQIAWSAETQAYRKQFLTSLKDGTLIEEEIKKFRPNKTLKQLGAWFGLFSKIVLAEFEDNGWDTSYVFKLASPTGIPISSNLLKEFMYAMCPIYDESGNRITMKNMDTGQMAKFFDDCRNFASTQWSIYVPEPDPKWRENPDRRKA